MAKECALVMPLSDGQILLGKMVSSQLRKDGSPNPFGLIGGTRLPGELFEDTARRETAEELHQRKLPLHRFRYEGHVRDEGRDIDYYIFSVDFTRNEARRRIPQHHEFLSFKWFTLDKVPWEKMLPGTRSWLEPILERKKQRLY